MEIPMMSLKPYERSVLFTPDNMPDADDHGVLVIGAGSIGERHARNLRTIGVKHIAVYDPDAERRISIAQELSCDDYATVEQALKDDRITIATVCSPTKFHIPQAIAVAAQGKHLFIEKPLSHTEDGLKDLQRIVKENNLMCMVGCNMRFHFGPQTVKRFLDEGKIGTPKHATVYTGSYLPDWRPKTDFHRSYSADPAQGGAILDCIHEIDLAQWYLGDAKLMECTLKQADTLGIPVEGTASVSWRRNTNVSAS
jgi:predicted dehydrogenase